MSTQGAMRFAQSFKRERSQGDVTNDAVVRCPNHALYRATRTNAEPGLFDDDTPRPQSYTAPEGDPVSRLRTARQGHRDALYIQAA